MTAERILFIQTETPPYVIHAIQRLKQQSPFRYSEILLLCREEDLEQFRNVEEVTRFLTFSGQSLVKNFLFWKQLNKFGGEIVCAMFSGRAIFWKQKLFFFLHTAKHHLAFDARLDLHEITARTIPRIFRQEPPLFDAIESSGEISRRVLLIQTEHNAKTLQAIESLRHSKLAGPIPIWVFCRDDKSSVFESNPGVAGVFTYSSGELLNNLKNLWKVARFRPNLLAAIFSERPIFRWHKLLFFFLPAKHRLVFNENLDCFYWKLTNFRLLFHKKTFHLLPFWDFLRTVTKIFLFLPRFFYLVIWATAIKLRGKCTF